MTSTRAGTMAANISGTWQCVLPRFILPDQVLFFFGVFPVDETASASRELWGMSMRHCFSLNRYFAHVTRFLPDNFKRNFLRRSQEATKFRAVLTLSHDSCVSPQCTVEYFVAELRVPYGSFPV